MKKWSLSDVFGDLIDFDYNMNAQPNEFSCSHCNTLLDGPVHVVAEEEDEEGHEWRVFCPGCWEDLDEDNLTLKQIYRLYGPAPYVGEDEWID